ncbi:hypothetical protein DPMN_011519 [Dreissena polymorpha]|uniref:Uncharacterized protein n=1 Tax=Dreissena polymorpha TaxID=45954 RepID=A0A9D4N6A4_DREPO|nr:hypothetical protein DPMN_011519 [Dreissena polymorpha]
MDIWITLSIFNGVFCLHRQSEAYERQCLEKLDRLIERARNLDDSLLSQKALLCRRLHGICKILQQE